jgi:hypothetical protein
MGDRLRMVVIVSIVTAVVWLFAEGESLTTRTESVRLQFIADDGDRDTLRLRIVDSFQGTATLELSGSQVGIEAARRALGTVVEFTPADLGFPIADGVYQVDVASAIASSDFMTGIGVKVIAATPARISLEYTLLETVEVEIEPVVPGLQLAEDATVDPARVPVRIPASLSEEARENLRVIARIPESQLDGVAEGIQLSRAVPVALDETSRQLRDVELLTPTRAAVRFTVESTAIEQDLASVPVWIVLPPSLSEQWSVQLASNQTVVRARIRGPREAVARIASSETPLIAVVSLDANEMLSRIGSKELAWFIRRDGQLRPLPSSVEVIEAERTVVNLTINERPAP